MGLWPIKGVDLSNAKKRSQNAFSVLSCKNCQWKTRTWGEAQGVKRKTTGVEPG